MALYNDDGDIRVTEADGNSRGRYAPDGSWYVNIDSGNMGLYGPNGCLNVMTWDGTYSVYNPDGGMWVDGDVLYMGHALNMGHRTPSGEPSLPDLSGFDVVLDPRNNTYVGGTLGDMLTCTRFNPPTAYHRTVEGYLTGFGRDTLRVTDYGILSERTITNVNQYSQDLTQWTVGNSTVTSNAALALDGTLTADRVTVDTLTAPHLVQLTSAAVTAADYTVSVYVKPETVGWQKFGIREGAIVGAWATFDLRGDGEVIAQGSTLAAYVEPMADGWYRVEMVYTSPNTNTNGYQLNVMNNSYVAADGQPLNHQPLGDGAASMLMWGVQSEANLRATSYIPTTSASVIRSNDKITMAGALNTALTAPEATIFAITRPTNLISTSGDRIVGTQGGAVPMNMGSDTQLQCWGGSAAATSVIPYSGKFSTDDVWGCVAWTASELRSVANGGAPVTNTATMATITQGYLASSNGSNTLRGTIACIAIKTSALSTAEMETLTEGGGVFNPDAVLAWGDSLTSGGQDGLGNYPTVLAGLLGEQVDRNGVGGETSTQIKDRFIAFPDGYASPNVFWMGRNNYGAPSTVKADIATCVAACTTTEYLVLGQFAIPTDTHATITTLNSDLATLYGTRFVDVRAALAAAGNGGTDDNTDIANGDCPRSLRIAPNDVHLNITGYTVIANAVYAKRALLGF